MLEKEYFKSNNTTKSNTFLYLTNTSNSTPKYLDSNNDSNYSKYSNYSDYSNREL